MKRLFVIKSLGPVTIENCLDEFSYPVRKFIVKDPGKWAYNEFYGTAIMHDAQVDLHEGDLVTLQMSFHVHKVKGKYQQEVLFNDIIKIKEGDKNATI